MCNVRVESVDFVRHIIDEHPFLFMVWASFSTPEFHTPEYLLNARIDDSDDTSYEYLMNLCDQIGYHRVGVEDVESVATYVGYDECKDNKCPICIEDIDVGRKINICGHVFCMECLDTWLKEHKTCPVCIRDVTQIASTSISSTSPSSMNTT